MLDIITKLEKRVLFLCRLMFVGYLVFFTHYLNNSLSVFTIVSIIFCFFIFEKIISFSVRWIYKIEPKSIIEMLQELEIKDIYKGMTTYSYSEDYIRSMAIQPSQSDALIAFKNNYYNKQYKFVYITLFDKNKKNSDKIELYKLLNVKNNTFRDNDLKQLLLSINLELSYIDNQFVLKNNYSRFGIDSLTMNEALEIFNKFINDIKVLFNSEDFEQLMKESYFELDLRFYIERNLLKKSKIDKTFSYGLNIQWSDSLNFMYVYRYKNCFRSGEAIRIHDNTRIFDEAKRNNITVNEYIDEKFCYSNIFRQIFNKYEDIQCTKIIDYDGKEMDENIEINRSLDDSNTDDILYWKKTMLKRKKVIIRYSKIKLKVNQSKWISKIKRTALNMTNKNIK